ncbi:MAG: nucleotide exchange factor GrpE [Dehalococcoidia bacterium]|nr:nucleotide exchange factor GrpE [Dehalococcoidia bacterium]
MTNEPNDSQENGAEPSPEKGEDEWSHLSVDDQFAALREYLGEARQEASQNLDTAQRAQAELANFRRRTEEERVSQARYSNGRLLTRLLPIVEELDLAVTHAGKGGPNASWLEGVMLIQRKLRNMLASEGVTAVDSLGALFNPLEHEALGTVETTEYPDGYVAQAIRPGYRLHDRVIQPAQVMVARDPQTNDQAEQTTDPKETENG